MNKEKIITILIGLTVGVVVTGGYFLAVNLLPRFAKKDEKIVIRPKPIEQAPPVLGTTSLELTLTKPDDKSSTTSATILVSGKTVPAATVIFFSNADEKIASADATGIFSSTLKLETGENELSVTAFSAGVVSPVLHRSVTLEISQ